MSYQLIKKNKLKSSSWIIIDLDHIFRRHYIGLKNYYIKNGFIDDLKNKDKSEIENYPWHINNEFILELSKQIKNKITNLVTINKYVLNNHVILTNNMIESKNNDWIWRASICPDWIKKYNQEFYRYRNDPIWKIMFDLTLNKFFLERGYIHFCHPDTEVDDIIAIIVKLLEQTFPDDLITIISQNSDFYQLINDKIIVLNINGEEDTSRILPSGEINLWFKIMNGQRSNYIPSLKFNNEFLKDFLKDDYDEDFDNDKLIKSEDVETVYRELTKKELYVVLHKLKLFQASLDTINDVVKDNQLIINQQIIDFNYIPKNIVTSIKKKFWLAYNKNNQLDQLDNNFGNKKSKEPLGTKLFNNKMLPTNHNIFSYLYVEDDENDNLSEENELSDYEN
jgi:hypothetical protein